MFLRLYQEIIINLALGNSTIPQEYIDLKGDHTARVSFIKWLPNLSLHPLTHTICNHISSLCLCSVFKEATAQKYCDLSLLCGEATPVILSCSLWFFLLITGLGWRLILSCVFLRADAQIGIWRRRQSFDSPPLFSCFSNFHQRKVDGNHRSDRSVNGYTRCIGNGERHAGSIDLTDQEWLFIVSSRNVHKVRCQEQR